MTGGLERRRDPQPLARGWELALVALAGVLLAVALAALLGLGVASLFFGGGWVWPHDVETATGVLGGLVTGDVGEGFAFHEATRVAASTVVYLFVAGVEFFTITAGCFVAMATSRHVRPRGVRGGMATRAEARSALGVRQLHRVAGIIRPDLVETSRRFRGPR